MNLENFINRYQGKALNGEYEISTFKKDYVDQIHILMMEYFPLWEVSKKDEKITFVKGDYEVTFKICYIEKSKNIANKIDFLKRETGDMYVVFSSLVDGNIIKGTDFRLPNFPHKGTNNFKRHFLDVCKLLKIDV
jgi:hypothetical protein